MVDLDLQVFPRHFQAGEMISAAGDEVQHVVLICQGFAARESAAAPGGRALTDLLMPLDFALLESLGSPVIDCDLVALTHVEAAFIAHDQLRRAADFDQDIAAALFRGMAADNGRLRSNLCNLARRRAVERVAYFLGQVYQRAERQGLVHTDRMHLPLAQRNLADLTGMSLVHINRTLQALRRRELVFWDGPELVIPSLNRLLAFASR